MHRNEPCEMCGKAVRNGGRSLAAWGAVYCGLRCASDRGAEQQRERAAREQEIRSRVERERRSIEAEANRRLHQERQKMMRTAPIGGGAQ